MTAWETGPAPPRTAQHRPKVGNDAGPAPVKPRGCTAPIEPSSKTSPGVELTMPSMPRAIPSKGRLTLSLALDNMPGRAQLLLRANDRTSNAAGSNCCRCSRSSPLLRTESTDHSCARGSQVRAPNLKASAAFRRVAPP